MATNTEDAKKEGRLAYLSGTPKRCNPYKEHSMRKAWWTGWFEAQLDEKEVIRKAGRNG